jgi:DNA primase
VNLDNLDVEQLVSYLGYDYRVSNGNSGLQLNLRSCPSCHRQDFKVYINADTGLGNCFQCSIGLNRYKLIKLTLGLPTHSAVMRSAAMIAPVVAYRPKVHPDFYKLNTDWVLPLNRKIQEQADLPPYLKERNVDAKLARRFDLRLCENGFYKYQDFQDRNRFVDFSNRILLPIVDIEGQLVTFQGRDITGKSEKKYLFPNMLPGTGRYIYNAHYALTNKAKKVVLNEGAFDVFATTTALESDVALKDWTACGTFGKHLSIAATNVTATDQLSDLYKLWEAGVEEFIILWDGEFKAIIAAMEAAWSLNGFGFNTTVAKLSDNLDPAEVGTEGILQALGKRSKPTQLDLVRMRLTANEEYSRTTGSPD